MRDGRLRWAMIGLDTNVLVRWLTGDGSDPQQVVRATMAIESSPEDVFLNDMVLVEAAWVLGSRYGLTRLAIVAAFRRILTQPGIRVARLEALNDALVAFENGGAGLSDHLIGAVNHAAGCHTTLTFDKSAAKSAHFTQLG